MKITPNQPRIEKVNPDSIKLQKRIDCALWFLLAVTSSHIIIFYFISFFCNIPETTGVKYAVYIAVGCFTALFVNHKDIKERFGPKEVEPYK